MQIVTILGIFNYPLSCLTNSRHFSLFVIYFSFGNFGRSGILLASFMKKLWSPIIGLSVGLGIVFDISCSRFQVGFGPPGVLTFHFPISGWSLDPQVFGNSPSCSLNKIWTPPIFNPIMISSGPLLQRSVSYQLLHNKQVMESDLWAV